MEYNTTIIIGSMYNIFVQIETDYFVCGSLVVFGSSTNGNTVVIHCRRGTRRGPKIKIRDNSTLHAAAREIESGNNPSAETELNIFLERPREIMKRNYYIWQQSLLYNQVLCIKCILYSYTQLSYKQILSIMLPKLCLYNNYNKWYIHDTIYRVFHRYTSLYTLASPPVLIKVVEFCYCHMTQKTKEHIYFFLDINVL